MEFTISELVLLHEAWQNDGKAEDAPPEGTASAAACIDETKVTVMEEVADDAPSSPKTEYDLEVSASAESGIGKTKGADVDKSEKPASGLLWSLCGRQLWPPPG